MQVLEKLITFVLFALKRSVYERRWQGYVLAIIHNFILIEYSQYAVGSFGLESNFTTAFAIYLLLKMTLQHSAVTLSLKPLLGIRYSLC